MVKVSFIIIIKSHKLKLISMNVRGLRNDNKRRAIFSYLKAQKALIFYLQEKYSSSEDEMCGLLNGVVRFSFLKVLRPREVSVFFRIQAILHFICKKLKTGFKWKIFYCKSSNTQ